MSASLVIVIITVIISYFGFNNNKLFFQLAHWPVKEHRNKEYYRLFTSAFVHGGWIHLLINMFVLWNFGEIVERYFESFFGLTTGLILYVLVYFLTVACASLPTYLKKKDQEQYMAVGASGGVSGIVFIFILLYPWEPLYLYAIIPIPGIIAGALYLWYSSYASKNVRDRIDHDAHFYGALFGVLFAILLKPSLISYFFEKLVNDFPL